VIAVGGFFLLGFRLLLVVFQRRLLAVSTRTQATLKTSQKPNIAIAAPLAAKFGQIVANK